MNFTVKQKSVITGSLLGDGHITHPPYGNSAFTKNQCAAHREYLEWHAELFDGMACPIGEYDNWANGKRYTQLKFRVSSHPYFSDLRKTWYPDGIKVVPEDIELDPLAIAVWLCDDGSNALDARRLSFHTNNFTANDIHALQHQLEQFDIQSRITGQNIIVVLPESYKTATDLVRPYIPWSCFQHKLSYRDSQSKPGIPESEVKRVLRLKEEGFLLRQIASEYNVSISHASSFIQRHTDATLPLNNKSGVKGVCWDKGRQKWLASFQHKGKVIKVGRFNTIEEATHALLESKSELSRP